LGGSQLAAEIIADPILVLGPEGAVCLPRSAFLSAIMARSKAVNDTVDSMTTLAGASAQSLGDPMVLATISWTFNRGDTATTLVSDFLLQREGPDALRSLAYLPRTNVLNHLA
jgi:hypothetical protein